MTPMQPDRFITIAIHTYEKAHQLKNILECEGIEVALQNVCLLYTSDAAVE